MQICSIDDCGGRVKTLGYCGKHYQRLRKKGSAEAEVQFRGTDAERFWRKVEKAAPDECWHWITKKGLNQYGQFRSHDLKRAIGAHAFSFYLANHYIPPEVMHTCDVRSCVNPKHLRGGTRKLNMADMRAKGRQNDANKAKGSAHHGAKLTEDDVRAIRASTESIYVAGERYGVLGSTISSIRRRKTWRHVT